MSNVVLPGPLKHANRLTVKANWYVEGRSIRLKLIYTNRTRMRTIRHLLGWTMIYWLVETSSRPQLMKIPISALFSLFRLERTQLFLRVDWIKLACVFHLHKVIFSLWSNISPIRWYWKYIIFVCLSTNSLHWTLFCSFNWIVDSRNLNGSFLC